MVLSMSEFFPTSRAGVGVPKRVAEALTTEDMATFGWHNKSSTLHDLEGKKPQQVFHRAVGLGMDLPRSPNPC